MSYSIPKTTFAFILHFVRQQWLKFAFLSLTGVIWGLNDAIFPYLLKHIINTLQNYQGDPHHIYSALAGILLVLALFWVLSEVCSRLEGIVQIYTFPHFRANIRKTVFNYVKLHSHDYFSNNFAGNVAKKLSDLPTSCQTIVEIFCFQFVTATTGALSVFIMMWLTKPLFAEILIIWLCFHMGITVLFMHYSNNLWEMHSEASSILNGKIVDVLTNILNVRLFAREKYETEYLHKFQHEEITKAKQAMWLIEIMRIGMGLSGLFLIFAMIFTLLYGWVHHWITLGDFTQVMMQSFWLLGWMWFVSFQIKVFARENGIISNALRLIHKDHDVVDVTNAQPISVKNGEIIFSNVSFAYHKNQFIFQNFNLTIPAGQKVGLVGFSGSGKSTFVNLLLRSYDIQQGQILIDKQNISEVTQESLRKKIAMIPQDPSLFHRSLMENIRYGRLDATDEEVINAAKLAHCHEFIEKLTESYHALVGERGIKLSGGQRQRIAIARAILKNAPILILDEATSSLDSVTEKLIQESLHHLMHNKTTIVVAHRLSTLANMDRILVFYQGKIIEDGTHAELLSAQGHFTMLWRKQRDGFLVEKASA